MCSSWNKFRRVPHRNKCSESRLNHKSFNRNWQIRAETNNTSGGPLNFSYIYNKVKFIQAKRYEVKNIASTYWDEINLTCYDFLTFEYWIMFFMKERERSLLLLGQMLAIIILLSCRNISRVIHITISNF